jgi:arylformamidase
MSGAKVFRDFDQAALDRQYNSRGTVPDYTVYVRRYAELTRTAKATLRCVESLRYGPADDETLDLYPPPAPGAPLVVFVHGGDWRALSKNESGFGALAYVPAGAGFAALNFSLVPHVRVEAMAAQVHRALAWLHRNARTHGCDPERIHVAGHSSGAQLVGQLLVADWRVLGVPDDIVKSATFMSGLGDLEPVRLSFRNAALGFDDATVQRMSLLRCTPTVRCPLAVAFGAREMEEYRRQGREVADFWRRHGNPVEVFELAGRNHYDAVLEWADPASALHTHCCRAAGLTGPS